jgi:DNA polymerase (family 10)
MALTNGRIIDVLEQTLLLLELHEENQFKIRGMQNAIFYLEKQSILLNSLSTAELEKLEGVGKGIAAKITEINETGTTQELQNLLKETPAGVVEMLVIKGIGPKKVRTLWKEANVVSLDQLYECCVTGKVAAIKGFGEKTQETIRQSIEFLIEQKGKFLFSEAEVISTAAFHELEKLLKKPIVIVGEIRRCMEVVEKLSFVVADAGNSSLLALEASDFFESDFNATGPFVWRGKEKKSGISVEVFFSAPERFGSDVYLHSSSLEHLKLEAREGSSFLKYLKSNSFAQEKEIFTALGLQEIPSEYREGYMEVVEAREKKLPKLLEYSDLTGAWHNHSVWSDGKNTIEEMAQACLQQGWKCFGISDHSQTAIYANGLQEFRVKQQLQEIDALNNKLAPFKIFKGIESDILQDGSLDYPQEILALFDYVVASIHSGLNMTEEKATERLITAIENPYTTMLGHPTGRLLLRRQGYPINHKKIIDACAANNVIIEINANPWRLDVDWRWVRYAVEKGVIISINPDAHEIAGLDDMRYGMLVARKAGLTAEQTFNTWSLPKIEEWLQKKKSLTHA